MLQREQIDVWKCRLDRADDGGASCSDAPDCKRGSGPSAAAAYLGFSLPLGLFLSPGQLIATVATPTGPLPPRALVALGFLGDRRRAPAPDGVRSPSRACSARRARAAVVAKGADVPRPVALLWRLSAATRVASRGSLPSLRRRSRQERKCDNTAPGRVRCGRDGAAAPHRRWDRRRRSAPRCPGAACSPRSAFPNAGSDSGG